jgi:hypothetical protein
MGEVVANQSQNTTVPDIIELDTLPAAVNPSHVTRTAEPTTTWEICIAIIVPRLACGVKQVNPILLRA